MLDLQSRIIWLAGFLDGEGTITVFTHTDKSAKYRFQRYTPIVCVANTDPTLINEVQKIIGELSCNGYLYVVKGKRKEHKDAYQLSIRRMAYVKIILEKIIPYLIGKKAQAEITLRFINSRINRKGTGNNNSHSPYNDEEKEFCKMLYSLNKKGPHESSEAIRQTAKADDMVRAV